MIDKHLCPPLIGLPARMDPGKDSQYLSRQYPDAVLAGGGTPIIVPLVEVPESLRPLADILDGILLTGSRSDVDPAGYSAAREEACGPVQPLRDKTDFMLLEVAARRRIPVLAICFGLQSLNVFAGGSLIQDIATHLKTPIWHSNPSSNGRPSHPIDIAAGSLLEELAGGTQSKVNSTHHQAVARVGRNLEVIARAPDGVIEALAGEDSSHWILGVQWHPEKSFSYDRLSRRIFELFIASCTARRETYERSHSKDTQGNWRRP
jgi:putative glutamine amidotransferase